MPRPAGAWAAYLRDDKALEAVRMDDLGALDVGPVSITPSGHTPVSFAATAFGGGIVLAFVDDSSAGGADLVLLATDPEGVVTATTQLDNPPLFSGAPSIWIDQDTRKVLVAFSGPIDAPPGSAVFVARFACR